MDVKMIRTIQPASALPVTRNMPYHTASVPSRNQPRNMTGIYLGLEGNIKPPKHRNIIPFVKTRAGMSPKTRTTAEDRRYKKVELLRIKEETRGFRGQTVKNASRSAKATRTSTDFFEKQRQVQDEFMKENIQPRSSKARQWGPAKSANPTKFEDIIRQNTRNYTHVVNNGVTRSENLQGFMSFADQYTYEMSTMLLPDALIEEVQRVAGERDDLLGLEECYKKVCKGSADSLHSLLPLRKGSGRQDSYSTGFSVRSYRNPNKAELLADFEVQPLVQTRPKTVPATHLQRQPHVPAPYFFKYYNKPKTAGQRSGKSPSLQFEASCMSLWDASPNSPRSINSETYNTEQQKQMNSGEGGDKIFGASGSGAISRSLRQTRTAWSEEDVNNRIVKRGTPRLDSPLKDNTESRHIHVSMRSDSILTNTEPLEIRAEGYQSNTDDKLPLTDRTANGQPPNTTRSTDLSSGARSGEQVEARSPKKSSLKSDKRDTSQSGSEESPTRDMMDGRTREPGDNTIRLDLETEDGKKQEIILDDREFKEKENITKTRESEAIVASLQADAENRRKEFEQILDEHAEIVTAITHQSSTEGYQDDERDP